MRAVHVSRHGGPEVLEPVTVDDPTPGPGDLLVRVGGVGVNFIDTYLRSGYYPSTPPYIPGTEGAGTVVAVGDGVSDPEVGTRVAWCDVPNSYAELVVVPADRAVVVPDGVDDAVAATVLLQGCTAHYLLDGVSHPRGSDDPGGPDTVLMHAGAGGVGLILTRLAAARGIRVITTVSTDAKEQLSRDAGAAHVLRYGDDVGSTVRDLTDGRGVVAVYDGVGADTFEQSLLATARRGTVALFGAASGPVPPFDLQRLNGLGSLFVTRPTLAHHIADAEEFAWRTSAVMGAVADGTVPMRVDHRYPLDQAQQAHTDLEARATTGSIALIP
ncbi:quinone oxidoreductase family protein [Williamsia deligens]|uniref:Quinone oxidoreductase family protein n=1 Tax=Williamsia deligens TaxID=321325 RepID=A0ABW3GG28_9NOCA|nr:quinone oxidoreductase [Williamsia deligens]MCP2195290.1 NADPH2:quinone reductase [Williamsia deligens]